jgi:hypothetical protein
MANLIFSGSGRSRTSRRTSLRGGAVALVAAVALAILCLGVVLLLILNLRGGCVIPSPQSQMRELLGMATAVGGAAIPLGLITWQFIRLIRRESGLAYLMAGLIEGLGCALFVVLSTTGSVHTGQLPGILLLGAAGAGIGLAFWCLARGSKGFGSKGLG